ncbi:MAG: methionine-rich copper-binding protein CopC [Glaciecola sp.]|jgi:methionine-rich copper-binding protein CopC
MKKCIAIIFIVLTSMSALAHIGLKSSAPADDAMLMKSPEEVEVRFEDEVRLVSLSVVNSKDEPVEINFAPSMEASKTFTYDLPMLTPSTYNVSWTIMGEDGHKMKGDFSFMVHATEKMKGMKGEKMDHSQHDNY